MAEMETVVSAVGLNKVFRDFWNRPKARAVNDIDFEIHQGEVVGLLGPNGSGKSTTVKMLLGLLYPTGGKLTVFGKSPRTVETKREIGYLPEESYLYKYLTAEETLDFFGSLFNLSRADRKRRIDQLLDMVGLAHARRRRVGEFSKGMARRIGIAQAMINDPSFLILDEPTSGLDPIGCREVKDLILELKKRGKTVLITSHLLSDVEDVCDRVIILYGGKIRASGSLNELLTVSDSNRIVTPELEPEVMTRLLGILREKLEDNEFKIDHPRRSLEDFFLEVVSTARHASVDTSGVVSGSGIADYLSAEKSPADASGRLLAELAAPESAAEPAEAAPAEPEKPAPDLETLVSELPEKPAPAAEPASSDRVGQLDEANSRLNDLLGGDKK